MEYEEEPKITKFQLYISKYGAEGLVNELLKINTELQGELNVVYKLCSKQCLKDFTIPELIPSEKDCLMKCHKNRLKILDFQFDQLNHLYDPKITTKAQHLRQSTQPDTNPKVLEIPFVPEDVDPEYLK